MFCMRLSVIDILMIASTCRTCIWSTDDGPCAMFLVLATLHLPEETFWKLAGHLQREVFQSFCWVRNEVFRYCIDCILVNVDMISLYIFSWFFLRSCPVIFVVHWNCIRMRSCCENWHYSSLTTPAIMWPGICCCTSSGCFNVISTSRSCCVEASVRIGDIAAS